MPAETPVDSKRKVERGEMAPGCPAHAGPDDTWKVQDFGAARALLRHTETRQAGFGIEQASKMDGKMRMPVLYRDGVEHREHRRQTAKYFTPKKVDTSYRELMGRLADEQCDLLRRTGEADLSLLSFRLAVAVAAEVIGLTESSRGWRNGWTGSSRRRAASRAGATRRRQAVAVQSQHGPVLLAGCAPGRRRP